MIAYQMLQVNIRSEKYNESTKAKQKIVPNYGGTDCREREVLVNLFSFESIEFATKFCNVISE